MHVNVVKKMAARPQATVIVAMVMSVIFMGRVKPTTRCRKSTMATLQQAVELAQNLSNNQEL